MPCGCGGANREYVPPAASRKATVAAAPRPTGMPAVWNGPSPKQPAK